MSESNHPTADRAHKRLISNSVCMPFLGIRRSDYTHFEYVVLDFSFPNLNIALPRWLALPERLRREDLVDLNFAILTRGRKYGAGEIIFTGNNDKLDSELVKLRLIETPEFQTGACMSPPDMRLRVESSTMLNERELFIQLIKDSIVLKKGIDIYLLHLVPLFSRAGALAAVEFAAVRHTFLDDIHSRLQLSVENLERYYDSIAGLTPDTFVEMLAWSDIETVFVEMQVALPYDIFELAFDSRLVREYIAGIKLLERRLFLNYNSLAALFCECL